MLSITRGRTFRLVQTFLDSYEGPVSDMTHITDVRCQIRTTGNNELIATLTAALSGETDSIMTITASRAATQAIPVGEYKIDVVGIPDDGDDESLMEPEPITVINRPSSVVAGDIVPADEPVTIPDFSDEFTEALED